VRGLAALALCACTGAVGTVQVELTGAPGAQVLDGVERLRLTLTDTDQVIEAVRTGSGFDLVLEFDASERAGALIIEGFDAAGTLVTCGQSPRFPISAIDARVVVYLAAPRTIGIAPDAMSAARSEVAAAPLSYGAVLAGGRDSAGAPTTSIAVYNAYDHTLVDGVALPGPRAGLAITATASGQVFLFGGTAADGNPTGTLWRFDTTVAPNGAAFAVSEDAALARTGQRFLSIANNGYLITGMPALQLAAGVLSARSDVAALPPEAATSVQDGSLLAIFAGTPILRFRGGTFDTLPGDAPSDAVAATLPDGRVVFFGGGDPASRDAVVVDSAAGTVRVITDALMTARSLPVIAATARHVLVAGGTDATGAPVASAELFDAVTLAPLATLPIVGRSGGFALALPNDQILLGGGAPATATLELFTPEPP
jgi:hypothetical protein